MLRNELHVYGDFTVSFIRYNREVDIAATVSKLKLRKHHTNNWLHLEIDFTGEADEGFGVASNKQGVRLKEYAAEKILEVIGDQLTELRKAIMEQKARHASLNGSSKVNAAKAPGDGRRASPRQTAASGTGESRATGGPRAEPPHPGGHPETGK